MFKPIIKVGIILKTERGNVGKTASLVLVFAIVCLFPFSAFADNIWNGNSHDSNWGTAGNWTGGVPTITSDNVIFDATGADYCKIKLGTAQTHGIWFDDPGDSSYIIGSSFDTLTLADNGPGIGGTGVIQMNNNVGLYDQTIGANIHMTGNLEMMNLNTGPGILNVTGNITNVGAAGSLILGYTTGGDANNMGNNTIGGQISDGSAAVTVKVIAGKWVLSGANTYTGGTQLSSGALDINNAGAIGTGGFFISGGTIDNTSGAAITNANSGNIYLDGNFSYSTSSGTADNNLNLGAGMIGNSGNYTITLNGSGALTFGGTMTNSSGLNQTLTVNNGSGTSGTTAVNFGGYDLSTDGTGHSGTINGSGNVNITGVVANSMGASSASSLTYSGTGTLTLGGNNTYSGGTTLSSGTIALGHNNAFGTGSLTLGGSGAIQSNGSATSVSNNIDLSASSSNTLTVNGSHDLALGGIISDAGNLAINMGASNILTLSGVNTYSGETTIDAGTVKLGNVAGLGSTAGSTTVSATGAALDINGKMVVASEALSIKGTGVGGTGALTNSNASSASYAGTITLGGDATIGGTGDIQISAITDGSNSYALTLGKAGQTAAITVNGNITVDTLSTVASAYNIRLQGTTNTITADTAFSNTGSVTLGNAIATTTFTGGLDTTAASGTSIAGTVATANTHMDLGAVSLAGTSALSSGTGDMNIASVGTGGNALTISNTGASIATVNGIISQGGSLTKSGTGTLVLDGANTYTGLTTIGGGVLLLNNSIQHSSLTTVQSGATLKGSGTTGALTVAGNISPGNSPGTLHTVGDATYSGGGSYTWEINDATGTAGSNPGWDLHDITGGLTIDATAADKFTIEITSLTLANIAGNTADFDKLKNYVWKITSTTTGITGFDANAFALDSSNLTNDINGNVSNGYFSLVLSGNSLELLYYAAVDRANFAADATNSNAGAVGTALDGIANPTGDMLTVFDTLGSLSPEEIGQALDTFTPVVDNGVTNTSNTAIAQFIGTATGRLESLFAQAREAEETGISAGSKGSSGFEAWGRGFGESARQDPRGLSNGYSATIWGTALGGDIPLCDNKLRLGASGGYASSDVNSKDNSGSTDIDSYQAALYSGYIDPDKPYYLNGAFSFAYNTYNGDRRVAVGPVTRIANASYRGQQYSALLDAGYTFKTKALNITPIASLQYLRLNLQSYTETGAGALDLSVEDQGYDTLETGLGAKFDHSFAARFGAITPEVHVRWLYDAIADKQSTTSTFSGGGGSFATNGFTPARSALNVGGRLAFITKGNWSFDANYDFEYKEDYTSHTGWADIRYTF